MPLGDLVRMPLPQVVDPGTPPYPASLTAASAAAAGTTAVQGAIVLEQTPAGITMTVWGASGPQSTINTGSDPKWALWQASQTAGELGLQLGPWKPRGANTIFAGMYPPGMGEGNPYAATPVLPDSALPIALKRNQTSLGNQYPANPNQHDRNIKYEADLWLWIAQHGGLKGVCRIPELGAPIWDSPSWITMQSQDQKFTKPYGLATNQISGGGPYDGTDTLLGEFRVPLGYDGVIEQFVSAVSADLNGHVEFSGDIVWRVKINARYARNLGNVTTTFGSFAEAFAIPGGDYIRLVSGQTVQLYASIPPTSTVSGGSVQAGVFGWFTPRR